VNDFGTSLVSWKTKQKLIPISPFIWRWTFNMSVKWMLYSNMSVFMHGFWYQKYEKFLKRFGYVAFFLYVYIFLKFPQSMCATFVFVYKIINNPSSMYLKLLIPKALVLKKLYVDIFLLCIFLSKTYLINFMFINGFWYQKYEEF